MKERRVPVGRAGSAGFLDDLIGRIEEDGGGIPVPAPACLR